MVINLTNQSVDAYGGYVGSGNVTIPAGKTLKIETTPDGQEILAAVVPAGKKWSVSISVNIIETDA